SRPINKSTIIQIDRTVPFNPAEFIGKDWSFWRGHANGKGLQGELEQDERSLALTEVDTSKILLKNNLKRGEEWITGEENLYRLKTVGTRLDLGIFWSLWRNQLLIPERFKQKTTEHTTFIFFDGQILRDPYGRRCTLSCYWDDDRYLNDNRWSWRCYQLSFGRGERRPSAVLAS
ncbi:MAG: hypothetical protein MN733_30545, partial [Nitrososphaera sp.]|nr:hypothetical protein [Nitrososphaera sp.]